MRLKGGAGGGSNIIHVLLITVVIASGYSMAGGSMPYMPQATQQTANANASPVPVSVDFSAAESANSDDEAQSNLQLKTFSGEILPTPGPPARTCSPNESVDVMLTFDYSGSMQGEKLQKAKAAAKGLVSILETNPQNRMGINSFNDSAKMYINVTDQHTLIKATIDNMPSGNGRTCITCGIEMANAELARIGTPAVGSGSARKKIDILLTDGNANRPQPENSAGLLALNAARQGYANAGVSFYTIGFGSENDKKSERVNETLLTQIANDTRGKYYYSPTDDHLKYIFEDIGLIICN